MKIHRTTNAGIFAALALLGGCVSVPKNQAYTTFYSQPPGAMLYEGNTAWGLAPQTRIFTTNPGQSAITSAPITAIWASGARVTTPVSMTPGIEQAFTFSRPPNAPGLDKDLALANQMQQNQIAQEQADAQNAAAFAAAMKASQLAPPVMTNCTTALNTVNCVSH